MSVRLYLALALLLVLAGCSAGDRSNDSDNRHPVFYGGVSSGGLPR